MTMATKKNNRLREIDFLRGCAIILVLLRHSFLFQFTVNMGWIGVDLFFVLSGFLVSGLLFKEHLKYGSINPGRFLIRRGFKIYPIFYLSYIFYLVPIIQKSGLDLRGLFADLTFSQNYFWGYGYAYPTSWSLAVEEHFYFALAFFLWLGLRKKYIKLEVPASLKGLSQTEIRIIAVMLICLCFRVYQNAFHSEMSAQNITMTHLRIDSLLSGVLISYLFYFRREYLEAVFRKYKYWLSVLSIAAISWTPFMDPLRSFFIKTIGFSLLYLSFSFLLVSFLLIKNINEKLNRFFTTQVVDLISKIGFCSYSIYIVHWFVDLAATHIDNRYGLELSNYSKFAASSFVSIGLGILITSTVESWFLRIRDKFYPPYKGNLKKISVQGALSIPL